jgi:very-short-patch-repair endonuclease
LEEVSDMARREFPSRGGVDGEAGRGGREVARSDGVVEPADNQSARVSRSSVSYYELPYDPTLRARARELRKAGNLSEVLLWNQLKSHRFQGLDFDRQKIIGHYIVDFFCASQRVVIKLDGRTHDEKMQYDADRDEFLAGSGLTVIHIMAKDVLERLNSVMELLREHPAMK